MIAEDALSADFFLEIRVKPNDFYFDYKDSEWLPGEATDWVVTPKALWDSQSCISDQSEADNLVQPFGLERSAESFYESECENPDDTRDKLIAAGFIYKPGFLGSL